MRNKLDWLKPVDYVIGSVFTVVIIAVSILAYRAQTALHLSRERSQAELTAKAFSKTLNQDLERAVGVSETLDLLVNQAGGQVKDFDKYGKKLVDNQFIDKVFLAPGGKMTQVYPKKAKADSGLDLFNHGAARRDSALYALKHRTPVIQGPFTLVQGGWGFAVRYPIFIKRNGKERFWGFGCVVTKVDRVLKVSNKSLVRLGYNYRLYKTVTPVARKYTLVMKSKGKVADPVRYDFQTANKASKWYVELSPKGGWGADGSNAKILTAILVIDAMFAVFIFFAYSRVIIMRRFKKEALFDEMTQIYNRAGFDHAVKDYQWAHPDRPWTLVMIDVDDFKFFNDYYGHPAGDAVLWHVASSMNQLAHQHKGPDPILYGRNGGDEFCLAFMGKTADQAAPLIEEFAGMKKLVHYESRKIRYTLSIGYASFPEDGQGMAEVVDHADEALYAVKLAGKHGCQHYSSKEKGQQDIRSQLGFTLHELTAYNPAGLVIYEAKKGNPRILFVNHAMVTMMGYDDVWDYYRNLNRDHTKFVDPRDEEWVSQVLFKIFTGPVDGQSNELRYRVIAKDGQVIPVIANVKLVENPHYGLIAYQAFIKDRQADK